MTFLWIWMFLLLPLPWLVQRFKVNKDQKAQTPLQGALQVPFFAQLQQQFTTNNSLKLKSSWIQRGLFAVIWILLVTALARPALVGKEIPLPSTGRDLMLAIDLSGSMEQRDLGTQLNRLDVVKSAADEFIARREGDRLGLILFSDRAYLQAPLTFDRDVVQSLLKEAQVGLTGQKTAIGDAIAVGLKRLNSHSNDNSKDVDTLINDESSRSDSDGDNSSNNDSDSDKINTNEKNKESKVLVLLTDGSNNAGVMQPLESAQVAKKLGIKIYTIGVGGTGQVVNTIFGRQKIATSDLDEKTLTEIAEITGGKYFRATDAQGLSEVYKDIDALEPIAGEPTFVRPTVALYYYPATIALFLWMGLMLWQTLPKHLLQRAYNNKNNNTQHRSNQHSNKQRGE